MNADETVTLVLLFKQNHMMVQRTRQQASDCIRTWYNSMNEVSKIPWWKFYWYLIKWWKRPSPAAINMRISQDETLAISCWDWSSVVGMYTYEMTANPQERIARAIEKQVGDGEDWKKNEENE